MAARNEPHARTAYVQLPNVARMWHMVGLQMR